MLWCRKLNLQLAVAEKCSKNTESCTDIDKEAVFSVEQSRLANILEPLNKVLAPDTEPVDRTGASL